ncbi:spermidine/putrescine ABC transporter permease [Endozoicomonas montiporae]|uniref:Spermidine/putrescine ABC transporter permease n=2 Tax=Endozoicomonas montiporae TaxID=1027273 RepID=A0A081MYP9_9GAMM|nr:spermidine/putrescine ABC transporter permease [Endozoicomonas montiporae]
MALTGKKLSFYLLLTPLLLSLGLLVLLPQLDMIGISLRERISYGEYDFSVTHYQAFFTEPLYWNTFLRTAVMSILATFITLVIAFPIAWYISKVARGRVKSLMFLTCLIPFWVSELVRTYGWMILLRETGVVSNVLQWLGLADAPVEMLYNDVTVMMGLVYTSLLFMIVPLISTLEGLDDSLVEAAYDLGGNGWHTLKDVIVPYAMPGIVSGCIVVFMLTLGNYLTPTLLGGKDSLWFTEQIFTQFITRFNWEQGAAFGVLLLVLSSLIVWLGLKVSGQSFRDTVGKE